MICIGFISIETQVYNGLWDFPVIFSVFLCLILKWINDLLCTFNVSLLIVPIRPTLDSNNSCFGVSLILKLRILNAAHVLHEVLREFVNVSNSYKMIINGFLLISALYYLKWFNHLLTYLRPLLPVDNRPPRNDLMHSVY